MVYVGTMKLLQKGLNTELHNICIGKIFCFERWSSWSMHFTYTVIVRPAIGPRGLQFISDSLPLSGLSNIFISETWKVCTCNVRRAKSNGVKGFWNSMEQSAEFHSLNSVEIWQTKCTAGCNPHLFSDIRLEHDLDIYQGTKFCW